ncbi:helix-turn-helix domain-containing protein [Halorubrum sp. JWXQ-INN 858]|uniref:ArsR/SmtB family transcription factor n=1 Tax=Halorubrum sp. JWXQ-INN 858 TaxID=2690782 RepID=UPI0013576947|nr:helix-turn-helix domain-containing protein [Halorubrum sp. JWXQ-INN 858]MWV65037.1 helix-turn-helix domain-containing protein [Halorubrum sp. JWXQ-INN 858]
MSRLIPSLPDATPDDREPRIVGVDDDEADELIAALGSETARSLLSALHDEPATTSELAAEVDTSLQNVQYHLGRLSDADLVDVVDTAYSEKGREMDVYAPADDPLVLYASPQRDSGGLKAALKRLLGGYGLLAVLTLVATQVRLLVDGGLGGADDAAEDGTADRPAAGGAEADDDAAETAADPAPESGRDGFDGVGSALEDPFGYGHAVIDGVLSTLGPEIALFVSAALVFTVAWAYRYRDEWYRGQ